MGDSQQAELWPWLVHASMQGQDAAGAKRVPTVCQVWTGMERACDSMRGSHSFPIRKMLSMPQ